MVTPEQGQKTTNELFEMMPKEIEELYTFLSTNAKRFQTFDLLSYFSYYNHLHNAEAYSDYREDRNFFASEVLALLCLKNEFQNESTVVEENYMGLIMEMQQAVLKYCALSDLFDSKIKPQQGNTFSDIASTLSREAKQVRNPGLPAHHLIFSELLYKPIEKEIELILGFTISDTIIIRELLSDLITQKCQSAINGVVAKSNRCAKEIFRYRKSRKVEEGSTFTHAQLEEYSRLPNKQITDSLKGYFLNELFFTFSSIYTFTEKELADFTNLDQYKIKAFLTLFSCGFPSLKSDDKIYEPITILKTKPFIEHNGRYLIPSLPLVVWAVEEVVESVIKKNQKLKEKYPIIKHDFLLTQGLSYFKKLLPTATFYPPNLFYFINGDRCETDGLIVYDKILFIIEAKGNKITQKSKSGHQLKTQDHLKDLVRNSYDQAIRTLKYIEENPVSEFKTKDGKRYELNRNDFDDIIIISLIFEPIGNLSMVIKATNEIGYFNDGHFPWIISIYDLIIFADLFENPLMLIHYIKRRKKFLSNQLVNTYEELDLVGYFQANGLYIEHMLNDAEDKNVNWIQYMPETDAINDYYMYKFGDKKKFTSKPPFYISKELNNFLLQLDRSKTSHRVRMALFLLEFNSNSIKQLIDYIAKIKKSFSKDKEIHDCSIYTDTSEGGLGITFMTGLNKNELSFKLHQYCTYKRIQQNASVWVGFGDTSTSRDIFNFESMYLALKDEV